MLSGEIVRRYGTGPHKAWAWEPLRREYSERLAAAPAEEVVALAVELFDSGVDGLRWFGSSLVHHHPKALVRLRVRDVEAMGMSMDGWGAVDAFSSVSGPAWALGRIREARVHRWARSRDRWWRRASLVSTIATGPRDSPFRRRHAKPRGGHLDLERSLAVCRLLLDDRDDMVEKALSWVLRELAAPHPRAVRAFMTEHRARLAARVRREVANKLETGLKNPPRGLRT